MVFFPLSMLNCVQSYRKSTFPSAALDPRKTLSSSFAFALEHLYLGWHHECCIWRRLLQIFWWLALPFSRGDVQSKALQMFLFVIFTEVFELYHFPVVSFHTSRWGNCSHVRVRAGSPAPWEQGVSSGQILCTSTTCPTELKIILCMSACSSVSCVKSVLRG